VDRVAASGARPPNKPMNLTIPPQGHRSIIERPARAASPRVNGKAFDGNLMSVQAGIARDSCPHCGERVWVGIPDLLPGRRKIFVVCDACGKRSQVAGSTRIWSNLTGLVVGSVWSVVLVGCPQMRVVGAFLILPVTLAGAYFAGRMNLRLDPPELGD
jgi:hypothetical protein